MGTDLLLFNVNESLILSLFVVEAKKLNVVEGICQGKKVGSGQGFAVYGKSTCPRFHFSLFVEHKGF